MRLFIAINFGDGVRERLLALRDELRSCSRRGNFSEPSNLHLTLAFLGECDAGQTSAAKAAMDGVSFQPFPINIDRVGCFKRNGGIWWAGIQASKPLTALQRALTDRLTGAGFTLDGRAYDPHVTLGREVTTGMEPWRISPFGETATVMELMKSERINGRLVYTAIHKKTCEPRV